MKKNTAAVVFLGVLFLSSSFAYSQNGISDTSEENPLKIVLDEVDAAKRSEISAYRSQLIGHGDYKRQFAKLKSELNDLYNR